MTDKNKKKQNNKKNTVGSVVAGVAGAVAIAGVAVAATIALKDKKSREKVKKVLVNVKDQAMDYVETLKKEPNVKETTNKVKKIAKDTKKVVEKNT